MKPQREVTMTFDYAAADRPSEPEHYPEFPLVSFNGTRFGHCPNCSARVLVRYTEAPLLIEIRREDESEMRCPVCHQLMNVTTTHVEKF